MRIIFVLTKKKYQNKHRHQQKSLQGNSPNIGLGTKSNLLSKLSILKHCCIGYNLMGKLRKSLKSFSHFKIIPPQDVASKAKVCVGQGL